VKALVFQARESLAGWRQARDTDCRVIREQLATLSGGALRRAPLRRHLDTCDGCREFRSEVRRQREAMALLLPVVPSIALKAKVIGAIAGGGHIVPAAGLGAGALGAGATVAAESAGGGLAALGSGLAGKALVVAAVAGTAGGGYAVVRDQSAPSVKPAPVERVVAAPAAKAPRKAPTAVSLTQAVKETGTKAAPAAAAKAKAKHEGRPAVPGANGFDSRPTSQGLAHRPATPPGQSGKANGKVAAPGQTKKTAPAGADATARGRSDSHRQDARPKTVPKASRPAKPAPPTSGQAAKPDHTAPGQAKRATEDEITTETLGTETAPTG
jgi:hypothetical protein